MSEAKTIVVLSTKGGVGKTFLAVNLAAALVTDQEKKVLLVDLDHRVVGDMARMLDIPPTKKTMVDLIGLLRSKHKNIDIEGFIAHHSSGVDFVAGLYNAQQSPYLEARYTQQIFDLFRDKYDYIIIDIGCGFSELLVNTLNEANLILLVATPDILSISQTKWLLETLQSLYFPISMMKIALNRAESISSIAMHDIQVVFKGAIVAQIPSEGKVAMEAVNRGIPSVIAHPRSKVSKSIKSFAEKLIGEESLFIQHHQLDTIRLREAPLFEKVGQFWVNVGLAESPGGIAGAGETDELVILKKRIHQRLINELNLKQLQLKAFSEEAMKGLRQRAEKLVANFLAEETVGLVSSVEERRKLVKEIMDEALGLGPLEEFLADPTITDIMVNNKDEIYIERYGKLELTKRKFTSNEHVRTTIERIIAPIGRRIDESVPMVDARLPDGSRVNAIIPPLSLTGPTITIRKFRKERFEIEELIETATLNAPMAEFLKACVVSRKNIIVSGGTGSGKTTVLNVLSSFIPTTERIITIEDAAELKLDQDHWVRLESRPPNIEGKGAITIRDLFRNSLRMRPDRIVIGECRGLESLDMLQAMNTGHDGSMTTIHANSTHDVLVRLDSMILMSGVELPLRAIREMVASAIDVIVHTTRLSDGSRKIVQITELSGMLDDTHINLQDIFIFEQTGVNKDGKVEGIFRTTGYVPSFLGDLKARGIELTKDMFKA
jgi:septum site-determining protein MinD